MVNLKTNQSSEQILGSRHWPGQPARRGRTVQGAREQVKARGKGDHVTGNDRGLPQAFCAGGLDAASVLDAFHRLVRADSRERSLVRQSQRLLFVKAKPV